LRGFTPYQKDNAAAATTATAGTAGRGGAAGTVRQAREDDAAGVYGYRYMTRKQIGHRGRVRVPWCRGQGRGEIVG